MISFCDAPNAAGYTDPVRHFVIDRFISQGEVEACAAEVTQDSGEWVKYWNPSEKKLACNDYDAFGPSCATMIDYMQGEEFIDLLSKSFEISPLQSDPLLHGGGIHVSGNGGMLSVHLDYAKHPRLPLLERRLNAILYLTPYWQDEWGGATVFTKPDGKTVVARVYPKPGRLLVFATNDLSYHGVEPVTCPEGINRITLATYYLSHIRPGVTRERALFVPQR